MTAKAAGDTAALLAAYDLTALNVIADIGGGRGHLLRPILDAAPDARGILWQRSADVEEHARGID